MSAHIVNNDCINRIVTALTSERNLGRIVAGEDQDWLGRRLLFMNEYSVAQRYNEPRRDEDEISYRHRHAECSLVQLYKSLECFLYQCCEGDTANKFAEYDQLERFKNKIAAEIIRQLPEYNAAKWG